MKLFVYIILVLCFTSVLATSLQQMFNDFVKKYGKKYPCENIRQQAFKNFCQNYDDIQTHNAQCTQGRSTYMMGINQYADMKYSDAIGMMCKTNIPAGPRYRRSLPQSVITPSATVLPSYVNFTAMVQPPVDQGYCGSCWSFAACAQVESLYKRINISVLLSPQYLVDCSTLDHGCDGGRPGDAMKYMQANGAAPLVKYPYVAMDQQCSPVATQIPRIITSVKTAYLRGNETQLQMLLIQNGPIVVCIQADDAMGAYKSGIYVQSNSPTDCSINHSVLLVGYGTDPVLNMDYWLIKNSWGIGWGENGYLRIVRNQGNNASVACWISYAVKG